MLDEQEEKEDSYLIHERELWICNEIIDKSIQTRYDNQIGDF
jgi:hypothetical protein